jgi:hypothetical protein
MSSLPVEVAEALAGWKDLSKNRSLSLDGLRSLPVESAEALAGWEGYRLSLGGMSSLPVEVAEALAGWKGRYLTFDGLMALSKDALRSRHSLLHFAGQHGGIGMVHFLSQSLQFDKNSRDSDGWTCLHHAARSGHWDLVRYLFQICAQANECEPKGQNSALHFAAAAGNSEMVMLLLAGGAKVYPRNSEGKTPLDCAIESGDIDTIRLLAPK